MRPTITHAVKVMEAIADCAKAIKTLGKGNGSNEIQKIAQLIEIAIQQNPYIAATPTTIAYDPSILRVPLDNKPRQTRSMTQPTKQLSTVSTPVVPRVERTPVAKQKS